MVSDFVSEMKTNGYRINELNIEIRMDWLRMKISFKFLGYSASIPCEKKKEKEQSYERAKSTL